MQWHKEGLKKFHEKTKSNHSDFTTVNGTEIISQIFRMIISGEWSYEKTKKDLKRVVRPDAWNTDYNLFIESGDYSQDKCLQDLIDRELPKYCAYTLGEGTLICSLWGLQGGIAIYQNFEGKDSKDVLPILELNADDYYKYMLDILEGHKDNQLIKTLKAIISHDTLKILKNRVLTLGAKLPTYQIISGQYVETPARVFTLLEAAYNHSYFWRRLGKKETDTDTEASFLRAVLKCKEAHVPFHELAKEIIEHIKDHKNRHKLGQFFTKSPHARKVAEKVWEVHQRTGLKMKESTVGVGAITIELIKIIKQKHEGVWREYCQRFLLPPSDISDIFAPVAEALIKEEGLDYKVEVKDVFNIKKFDWIEYGNPPYNAGSDYNYLARMVKHMLDCGLKHFVFMTNTTLVDNRMLQQKKILEKDGKEFYTHIQHFLEDDIENYGCRVAFVEYDINKITNNVSHNENFNELQNLVNITQKAYTESIKFKNGAKLYSDDFNPQESYPFLRQSDITTGCVKYRIPKPDASIGSKEREIYTKWAVERKTYPKITTQTFLALHPFTTSTMSVAVKYFENYQYASYGNVKAILGEPKILGCLGLILQSSIFKKVLNSHFPKWQKNQVALYTNKLKTMPIPKNIPQRLYDIGLEVIIKGNENKELRLEADKIIEELYKDLKC